MADAPLVSVVIPVYNRAVLLREAVCSVLEQDWRPLEIVLVDDGSTDSTLAVARSLACDHPGEVVAISRPNGGPGAARQTGFEASRGEFIQFLDSDDLLLPGKLRAQVDGLSSDPDAGIAYGRTLLELDGERRPAPQLWSSLPTRQLFPRVLNNRFWDTSNPLYRRRTLERMGPWAPRRQLEDWEFDCRAAALRVPVHYCDRDVDVHRSHANNRLQNAWLGSDEALRDRVWAHERVLEHALSAELDPEEPEFQTFVRTLFLMARMAGARNLVPEATRLYTLVHRHARQSRIQIGLFGLSAKILGWRRSVLLGEKLRRSIT